jgi:hypothetical protein
MDPQWWWIIGAFAAVAAISLALLWRPMRKAWRADDLEPAQRAFRIQRERLEHRFFEIAAASGKPRGLRWADCDFDNDVTYARSRTRRGELQAFVGVTISFEAIEGGGMEDVEAVGNLRAATAVFHFDAGQWRTDGRAIFNLNPSETIDYYHDSLQRVVTPQPRRV